MADVSLTETKPETPSAPDVVVHGNATGFVQEIASGAHHFRADEPANVGGTDSAPTPYDYVLAGLGACTSMTVGLFARRKKWPLDDVVVGLRHSRIHAKDCEDCETKEGMLDRIDIDVELKRRAHRGAARQIDGDRLEMSRAPDAAIRDGHQSASCRCERHTGCGRYQVTVTTPRAPFFTFVPMRRRKMKLASMSFSTCP